MFEKICRVVKECIDVLMFGVLLFVFFDICGFVTLIMCLVVRDALLHHLKM